MASRRMLRAQSGEARAVGPANCATKQGPEAKSRFERFCFRWLSALLLLATQAQAGAWTEPKGHWQIISSFDVARASEGFGGTGIADAPIRYDKLYSKLLIEYGWSDRLTLIAAPEVVVANYSWAGGAPAHDRDVSFEAGARYRLSDRFGILSLQASYKSAGPSDLDNSIGRDSARIVELRVLYGRNFTLLGRDGFADLELAQRFVGGPRPSETVLDATAGWRLAPRTLAMVQSFNTVSGGDAKPPYTYFRTHKIETSLVRSWGTRWSLQLGAYMSPAGQNSLVEQGVEVAIWTKL